jgi:monothiol glutaredoxin
MNEALRLRISELIAKSDVVLFMKGSRHFPQCGFSSQVIGILNELGPKYETVNVLSDPEIRDGIKEFSSWPTIPQLYVKGTFVGGCDIVKEMYASGELQKTLGVKAKEVKAPKITLTEGALGAFREAAKDAGDDVLRVEINGEFQYELYFGPKQEGDIVAEGTGGIAVHVDRASAARADGMSIDFVPPGGPADGAGGFKIENPNEPPRVKPMRAVELKALLDKGTELVLIDVRPETERALAKIDRALALNPETQQKLASLDKGAMLVFQCHHGMRSRNAAEQFLREGFRNVYNLEGGIEAWSAAVDPNVPRY